MKLDLVGTREIAERLGISVHTVHGWSRRRQLPEPEIQISGLPGWRWTTIAKWLEKTGRGKLLVVSQHDGATQDGSAAPAQS